MSYDVSNDSKYIVLIQKEKVVNVPFINTIFITRPSLNLGVTTVIKA